ncbi:MAG TPA: Uma2 family endonuclease [Thioploca sp.]|nr:Uma2 family endonuclease [Thioploca sp.]
MNELTELENEEYQEMGSYNHSYLQTRIAVLLSNDERFTPLVELSLDASQIDLSQFDIKAKEELKPDVCVYPKAKGVKERDIVKVSEMPLLAIEVVSPSQSIEEIVSKFDAYFALGVKSCWLVVPTIGSVAIFSARAKYKNFDAQHDDEVIDETIGVRLPIRKVFFDE